MMLFGGMPHGHGLGGWTGLNAVVGHMANGDNSYGWRFLDVVFGALAVMLLYVFAKRITGSTVFAAIAALLLTADGMHFVQSRIATPEGFVIFFATLATYAFYRFWVSSQVGDRPHVDVPEWGFAAAGGVSLVAGLIIALSGRNRLRGFVEEVRSDGLLGQVRLRIGDQLLTAVITGDAIHELKLRRGDDAVAIIKSTEVMIAREAESPREPAPRKTSRRRQKVRQKSRRSR